MRAKALCSRRLQYLTILFNYLPIFHIIINFTSFKNLFTKLKLSITVAGACLALETGSVGDAEATILPLTGNLVEKVAQKSTSNQVPLQNKLYLLGALGLSLNNFSQFTTTSICFCPKNCPEDNQHHYRHSYK